MARIAFFLPKIKLWLCGCGKCANPGRDYISGHNRKGKKQPKDAVRRSAAANRGKHLSEETKRLVSEARYRRKKRLGYLNSPKTRMKMRLAHLGKHLSEENKRKISESNKGRVVLESTRIKIGNAVRGQKRTPEQRMKMRLAHLGKPLLWKRGVPLSEEQKRKMSISLKGRSAWNKGIPQTEEVKEKIRQKLTGCVGATAGMHFSLASRKKRSKAQTKKWQDPLYRKRQIKAIIGGHKTKYTLPTKPEKKLQKILNKLFPGEYKYVGDGHVLIGYKNPDFINVNGQKKLIELFGDYWHSKKCTGKPKKENRKKRQEHFAQYGYKCCIVWECALEDKQKLIAKLKKFHAIESACELRRKRRYD